MRAQAINGVVPDLKAAVQTINEVALDLKAAVQTINGVGLDLKAAVQTINEVGLEDKVLSCRSLLQSTSTKMVSLTIPKLNKRDSH